MNTLNVRSIKGKIEEVAEEVGRYGIDILKITATKKKSKYKKTLNERYLMLCQGVNEKERGGSGNNSKTKNGQEKY